MRALLRSGPAPCGPPPRRSQRVPRSLAEEIVEPAQDAFVIGRMAWRQRLCIRGAVQVRDRGRHFVALPACELVFDEVDGKAAMFEGTSLALEFVDVIPPVRAKRVREQRSAEDVAHLLPGLADLQ